MSRSSASVSRPAATRRGPLAALLLLGGLLLAPPARGALGTRFPSERRVVPDPVTGAELVFLTSRPDGDRKIYPTHNQWTSDGKWVVFHSGKIRGEGMAVHEETGEMVQVTEGAGRSTLCVARKSMKLYYLRAAGERRRGGPRELVEVDLGRLLAGEPGADDAPAASCERVCGTIPAAIGAGGDMALDGGEEWVWFRVGRDEAARHLPEGSEVKDDFGPRGMGAGPGGIAGMNVASGELRHVVSVPFQVGHIQSNPWVPSQIVFCWETGGKSPQRTWTVQADGSGLRPLYPEADYEWVTHEAVITPKEAAFAIMGHRQPGADGPGQDPAWGPAGTREKPTGLGVVEIASGTMTLAGQIPYGSGFWHVTGSPDGRFLAGDNFAREIHMIHRRTHEMRRVSAGHKRSADDHPHPSFKPDGTKVVIQSAMLSEDDSAMNLCLVPVPQDWLERPPAAVSD